MASQADLLAPKLQIPRLPPTLIDRDRLLATLAAAHQRVLTLLCAPPGYGKTTLVRQWLQAAALPAAVAWVALDAGDNDPVRFWRYLITACAPLQADGGAAALAQLRLPPQPAFDPSPLEPALTTLLNALTQAARPGLLILDDYHVISAPRIHETLTFLLAHLPLTLHVVIITRHPPPLPLARLRARGELAELTAQDLRFTAQEMAAFLAQTGGPDLAPALLRQLGEQLEGWPAGLRLLSVALRGSATPDGISATLQSFAGSQRPILDYFVAEVLQAQPPAVQEFLLRTSTLRRLNGPLCDHILGTSGSDAVLAALAQANLFIEPLDQAGQWHRYHALFAEAMQAEARRRLGLDLLCRLSMRASHWYEQHGMLAEAVEAALHAQQTERAADLLVRVAATSQLGLGVVHATTDAEFHTLRRWFEQIPTAAIQQRPQLCISYATALLFVSLVDQLPTPPATLAQIDGLLAQAESAFHSAGSRAALGGVYAFRAMVARQRGVLDDAVGWGRQALALLPPDDRSWRSIALGAVGMGALAQGRFAEATQVFEEAHSLCLQIGNHWWTRANAALLSLLLLERGMFQQAQARFAQMLAEARAQFDRDDVARAQLFLAEIAYEWDDLTAAQQAASEALALGEHLSNAEIWVHAGLVLARVQHALGQTPAALQRLTVLLARLQDHTTPLLARLVREVQLVQASLQLAVGAYPAVQRWAQDRLPDPSATQRLLQEREARIVARLALAQGRPAATLELLTPMLPVAQSDGRARCAMEIRVLIALAHAAGGQQALAVEQLRGVLRDAAADGYRRLFFDQGPAMQALLVALHASEREPQLRGVVRGLLRDARPLASVAATAPPAALAEPLSRHERRVLRLLAVGRSNPEIAQELIVSVNTVRSQVQSIYRKLGVHSRTAASDLARRLDLLGDER